MKHSFWWPVRLFTSLSFLLRFLIFRTPRTPFNSMVWCCYSGSYAYMLGSAKYLTWQRVPFVLSQFFSPSTICCLILLFFTFLCILVPVLLLLYPLLLYLIFNFFILILPFILFLSLFFMLLFHFPFFTVPLLSLYSSCTWSSYSSLLLVICHLSLNFSSSPFFYFVC